MNLTPRAKFQSNVQQSRAHQDLVVSDGFRTACEAALLEQILGMPNIADPVEAAAAYNRICGATEYIRHLLSIAETTAPPKEKLPQNLNYRT